MESVMLALSENPPQLPASATSVADIEGEWIVTHTKPRQEKALANHLLVMGVPYYLPMLPRTFVSGGRKRHAMDLLFPSYLFAAGPDAKMMAQDRSCAFLLVPQQAKFVSELIAIERAIASGAVSPSASIPLGAKVRVRDGPLMGVEGTVIQRGTKTLLVVWVKLLGRGAEVEVDRQTLEIA
jgi:transcriptional antiterminator RfaH